MGTVVAIVSIGLALVAAASIAYIAWELTSSDTAPDETDQGGRSERD